MSTEYRDKINSWRTPLWILTFVFAVIVLFYTFWALLASTYEHTFLRPATAPTGQLFSQRFSADFFFTGSLLLLFFVPLTMAFILGNPFSIYRQNFHIIFVMLLLVYYIVIALFWGIGPLKHRNEATAGNAYNPANDDRWCCVNFAIAGTSCPNTIACPGVTDGMLTINDVFLYKFCFLLIMIALIFVNLIFVSCWLRKWTKSFYDEQNGLTTPSATTLVKGLIKIPYRNRKQ